MLRGPELQKGKGAHQPQAGDCLIQFFFFFFKHIKGAGILLYSIYPSSFALWSAGEKRLHNTQVRKRRQKGHLTGKGR